MCTCVCFCDQQQHLFFGRNLDVSSSYGERVMITPRNYHISFQHISDIHTTKAVIGMGILEHNMSLYFDAANENGLCIANLNFPYFAYYHPTPIPNHVNLTSYEFMMWVLQNFDTVHEVKQALQNVVFVNTSNREKMRSTPAHWLISDEKNTIVVEPTKDGVCVYDNLVGVLTNNPTFDWHLLHLHTYVGIQPDSKDTTNWKDIALHPLGVGTGTFGLPGDFTPQSRFIKAAYINLHYPTMTNEVDNINRMFHTLQSVAMPLGSVRDEVTMYQSCYSTHTQTYYYQRVHNLHIQQVSMQEHHKLATHIQIY